MYGRENWHFCTTLNLWPLHVVCFKSIVYSFVHCTDLAIVWVIADQEEAMPKVEQAVGAADSIFLKPATMIEFLSVAFAIIDLIKIPSKQLTNPYIVLNYKRS